MRPVRSVSNRPKSKYHASNTPTQIKPNVPLMFFKTSLLVYTYIIPHSCNSYTLAKPPVNQCKTPKCDDPRTYNIPH